MSCTWWGHFSQYFNKITVTFPIMSNQNVGYCKPLNFRTPFIFAGNDSEIALMVQSLKYYADLAVITRPGAWHAPSCNGCRCNLCRVQFHRNAYHSPASCFSLPAYAVCHHVASIHSHRLNSYMAVVRFTQRLTRAAVCCLYQLWVQASTCSFGTWTSALRMARVLVLPESALYLRVVLVTSDNSNNK